MKKAIISFSAFFSTFFSFAPVAHAAPIVNCTGQFNALCKLDPNNFGLIFSNIINIAFVLAIVIALFFLIWGGIKWITSGGEKAGVEEAKNHVVAAVVGLIIVFLSYFILNLVVFFFTGTGLSAISLPTLSIGQ